VTHEHPMAVHLHAYWRLHSCSLTRLEKDLSGNTSWKSDTRSSPMHLNLVQFETVEWSLLYLNPGSPVNIPTGTTNKEQRQIPTSLEIHFHQMPITAVKQSSLNTKIKDNDDDDHDDASRMPSSLSHEHQHHSFEFLVEIRPPTIALPNSFPPRQTLVVIVFDPLDVTPQDQRRAISAMEHVNIRVSFSVSLYRGMSLYFQTWL
jgi:hypothetical protein